MVATGDKRTRTDVTPVRIIEYSLKDPGRPESKATRYRLVTTIIDPEQAPADELGALYGQRWEIESVFDELKTHQRGPRVILCSRTPQGVYQEAWGLPLRALRDPCPDQQSGRRRRPRPGPDLLHQRRPRHRTQRPRPNQPQHHVGPRHPARDRRTPPHHTAPSEPQRANARVIGRKMSKWHVKRAAHRNWPQPQGATIHLLHPTQVIGIVVKPDRVRWRAGPPPPQRFCHSPRVVTPGRCMNTTGRWETGRYFAG